MKLTGKKSFKTFFNNFFGGFSVVELLVSIGIIAVVSSVVIVNQSQFNSTLELDNAAHQVALKIREAQNNALNVNQLTNNSDADVVGYGLAIPNIGIPLTIGTVDPDCAPGDLCSNPGNSNNPTITIGQPGINFFIDSCASSQGNFNCDEVGQDGRFSDSVETSYSTLNLYDLGYKIDNVCAEVNNRGYCFNESGYSNLHSFDVSFVKPFIAPKMYVHYSDGSSNSNSGYIKSTNPQDRNTPDQIQSMVIILTDLAENEYRYISIGKNGQVAVVNKNPIRRIYGPAVTEDDLGDPVDNGTLIRP